ncbi:hypothetical protein [Calothrix sp. 336/3]|uniref:hypothetical protein n=1 Tax=Calothrix sp. 336/3 TaxID=1337936 RepID=UPI0004E3BCA4|nr:hypothetical protein [Calothrix sp. 336/3]AKG19979.1 hypothetical protein IJ00_00415 [Calothrix sp. 336/3]
MHLYFLQILTDTGIDNAINSGAIAAKNIAEGWDQQWLDLLQNETKNNLYGALTNLGIFFAVGTLLLFMVQWLRDVLYSEFSRPFSALIWPFIVVVLLANSDGGSPLSNLTLGVRNFLNNINQQVVTTADANLVYQQAINMSIAEDIVGSLLRPCQALSGEQQTRCFIKANDKVSLLWQEYRNLYGDRPWISRLENKVNQIIFTIGGISENTFNALLGSNVQTTIKSFLVSLQYAFQNLIEASMLLIAALGPLAVGGSLLPVAGKPIFAWLTGFLAMGIAKISFNIIAVLTATVIVNGLAEDANADPDLMWFIIFLGILAPLLSLIVATVGGVAIFNAASYTTNLVRENS